MTYAVETANLTKIFGSKIIAVNNMNLKVEEGTIYGFLGPNGAGKTTVIRLLLGLIMPTAGRINVFGEEMNMNSAHLRKRIGYLPTNPKLSNKMTPITYLDFVGKLFSLSKDQRISRLSKLIRSVGLLPSASREVNGFSTGMVTRLALAASLMNNPDLLLLDEPTSGLDPAGRKSTLDLIEELDREKTIFVSSHILSDIDRICTHVGIINEGKLIYSGSIKEMKKHIQSNVLRLEIDGDVNTFCNRLESIGGMAAFERRGDFTVEISFISEIPTLKAIQDVIGLIVECNLDLISMNSSTSRIEDAFLRLLEEEESRGFLRAI
ncbi:MAG: ABC transporter ATP-binding protein [Candidatus Thorarchaeota archaeon]|jgi:ABC-2 type transport system ATP-binding protein|nr:ABC transporter ATP-binding protein [Candidatus Thorarchaeota archaeon]